MKISIRLLANNNKLFNNLKKSAKNKLKALNAEHVVFGVERNAKGQVSTFFIAMTDKELWDYSEKVGTNPIYAVHA